MGKCKRQLKASHHLIWSSCDSWVESECANSWRMYRWVICILFRVCKTVKYLYVQVDELVVMKSGQGELDCVQPGGETGESKERGRAETMREM